MKNEQFTSIIIVSLNYLYKNKPFLLDKRGSFKNCGGGGVLE